MMQSLLREIKPATIPGFHVTSTNAWDAIMHTKHSSHFTHFYIPVCIAVTCITKLAHDGVGLQVMITKSRTIASSDSSSDAKPFLKASST